MSRIVYERVREICPQKKIADMSVSDIKHDCRVAFAILGYEVIDLNKAFERAWESSNAIMLYEFVFDVWEADTQ